MKTIHILLTMVIVLSLLSCNKDDEICKIPASTLTDIHIKKTTTEINNNLNKYK